MRLGWWRLGVIVGLGGLSVALLLALGGGRAAVVALTQADWRWIMLALVVHYSGFAVRGWRWQQLLAVMGHRLPWRYTMVLLLGGWFISALAPARAGDAVRVGVLWSPPPGRERVPVAAGVGSLILERALDLLAILLLGAGFAYFAVQRQFPAWVNVAYATGLVALLLFAGTLLVAPTLLERWRSRLTHPLWHKFADFVGQLLATLRTLGERPQQAFVLVAASLYIWLCDVVLLWAAVRSLGHELSFALAGFVALTVDVFAAVPLTPGGIGQVEVVNAALLAFLGLPEASVAAAVLVNRGISYWSFLVFSGLVTFSAGLGVVSLLRKAEKSTHGEDKLGKSLL
jgi:glycosyltransferase AglD